MSDDEPKFGYGLGRRPLWSERDRDAERVRDALRGAELVEFSDGRNGFVVEGGGRASRSWWPSPDLPTVPGSRSAPARWR